MKPVFVKKSEIRTAVGKKYRVGGDFYKRLDTAVKQLLQEAQKRATDNGRKTLRACDV